MVSTEFKPKVYRKIKCVDFDEYLLFVNIYKHQTCAKKK